MGILADQAHLSIAIKAKPLAYSAYLTGAWINSQATAEQITFSFKDAATIIDNDKDCIASLTHLGEAKNDQKTIVLALSEHFKLFGGDAAFTTEWIEFAYARLCGDFKAVSSALAEVDDHLTLRTYLTDHVITSADLAVFGVLRSNHAALGSIRKSTFVNLGRWFRNLEAQPGIQAGLAELQHEVTSSTKAKADTGKKSSGANYEIGLQDAQVGKVVTRFPPEPSGYLHIGHAKAAMLNQYFAQKYEGKLLIRFDDTNPTKEKSEYQDSILEDLQLLGIVGDALSYTSDHFQLLYDYAIKLIEQGDAYVDDTDQATMRQQRMEGVASVRRDRSVDENLQLFTQEMKNATEVGTQNCLRAKMSVDDPNKALRDPVIYRVNATPHHRTGSTWKIYPTYDFCCPIVDSIEGVTHALRTIEYRDRNPQYDWFLEKLSLRKVHVWDFARMNFVRTLLSKRKLQWFVDQGHVRGWDDPRFPTVRGIRRRGMQIAALREFILSQGPSKNINNLEWTGPWSMNKKEIDPVAPRHTAVSVPVKVAISGRMGAPAASSDMPKHKKNPELGMKKTWYSDEIIIDHEDALTLQQDEEITLMDWGNAIVRKLVKSEEGITVEMDLHLEGDFKKTSKKLTWLSTTPAPIEVEFHDFDHLITKEKLEDGDDVKDFITPQSEFVSIVLADVNVKDLKKGDVIQFERKGYFVVDVPFSEGEKMQFFTVPDGKTVSKYGAKN